MKTITPNDVRNELTDMVKRDLLGPAGGEEEELDQREDHVYQRYLVGMLAPKDSQVEASELDELGSGDGDDGEEGNAESGVPSGSTYFPSSMGMSFVVAEKTQGIVVSCEWGHYHRVKSETQQRFDGNPATVWKREPIKPEPLILPMQEGNFAHQQLDPEYDVLLQGRMRLTQDGWVVSLFMVNNQEPRSPKDEAWLFQPKIRVHGINNEAVFVQRKTAKVDLSKMDPLTREETQALDMLYRQQREFAVGHGISTHFTLPEGGGSQAASVETEWTPLYEVAQQTPRSQADDENLTGLIMDMKSLAELPKEGLIATLRHIETAYRIWIKAEKAKLDNLQDELSGHEAAAQKAIQHCTRAQQRIKEGIDLINTNPLAEEAFRFANKAMWQQRIHSIIARKVRKKELVGDENIVFIDQPANRSWRLFQIAFVLLNLPSLTELHHPDRSHETEAVADLLWFATGGGKTEAYLGLTAYVLALRRLQGDIEGRSGHHGVAVLMRYTLRLLTLQQFQRAAALLCACEVIRRQDEEKWGETHFRLGLWVGNKTTPNTLAAAASALVSNGSGGMPTASGTPHQLTSCPWCGTAIKSHHVKVYEAPNDIGRCVTYCGDDLGRCDFSEPKSPKEGLPVMVVDEEIYRRPPSLLIATVDKFAQMPWKGETQMLFGKVSGVCSRHGFMSPEIEDGQFHPAATRQNLPLTRNQPHDFLRPPDLIIQDELHLISGPLGSMVGLYEAAVDELCSWQVNGQRVRPKVVASTATIRRAPDQIQKLFVRKLDVFPPQGTSIKDSFFALQRPVNEQYAGRRYLGVSAFGRRYTLAMIRVYVAHMAAAQALFDKYDNLADPWMTLAGYFNSIRELAGTRRLLEDVIKIRLREADQRGLGKRRIRALEELTSRKSGTDIPKILERLETTFDKAMEAQRVEDRRQKQTPSPLPYDVVLATNMISVGVDIERLGLMVVAGQPKNTSEYIQASSRVGRSSLGAGFVCTLYNWARPRDLSHYERFEHYHETFYKHVEALSVTPFSARALDRGLTGVMVAMLRLQEERMNANLKAGELKDDDPLLADIFDKLVKRAQDATHSHATGELMRDMLMKRRDEWLKRVRGQTDHRVAYQAEGGATVGLLEHASAKRADMFTLLDSLRDVEGTVDLVLDKRFNGLRSDN